MTTADSAILFMLVGFFVQVTMSIFWNDRVGKGRLFSRPLWPYPPFRPYISPYTGQVYAGGTRLAQQFALLVPYMPAAIITGWIWLGVIFWAIQIVLYMDDYLTGDDDRWKRFKRTVKNKVRWKQALRPVRVRA